MKKFLDTEMLIGNKDKKFVIKQDSIVQIKEQGDWFNSVGFVAYILDAKNNNEKLAYIFSPQKQSCGLFVVSFWNNENIIEYI